MDIKLDEPQLRPPPKARIRVTPKTAPAPDYKIIVGHPNGAIDFRLIVAAPDQRYDYKMLVAPPVGEKPQRATTRER